MHRRNNKCRSNTIGYYFAERVSKVIDTTFDYHVIENILHKGGSQYDFILPDSIAGRNITGYVEFYSIINQNGVVVDIEIIEIGLFKNGKSHFHYHNVCNKSLESSSIFRRFNNYIKKKILEIPFVQIKTAMSNSHKTYCFFEFK